MSSQLASHRRLRLWPDRSCIQRHPFQRWRPKKARRFHYLRKIANRGTGPTMDRLSERAIRQRVATSDRNESFGLSRPMSNGVIVRGYSAVGLSKVCTLTHAELVRQKSLKCYRVRGIVWNDRGERLQSVSQACTTMAGLVLFRNL